MNLPTDEIVFVTEASDKFLHLTRTCIFTFTKENQWFDGTIILLIHKSAAFSNRSLSELIKIYPKIELRDVTNNPLIEYAISRNSRFTKDPAYILDLFKLSLFGLEHKIIYSSYYNVFLKSISEFLLESSITINDSGLLLFYKDSNITLDDVLILDALSNDIGLLSMHGIDELITELITKEEHNTIQQYVLIRSTEITDKKYNQLSPKIKAAHIINFNSIKNKSAMHAKIDRLWQFTNKSSTRLSNRPANYTNREVANMRARDIARRKKTTKLPNRVRLDKPAIPKLGATYIVFDGIELLESAINSIREHVDFVCVAYQKVSWFGAKIKAKDVAELNKLKKIGLIDSLIEFSAFAPVNTKSKANKVKIAKSYEIAKRNFTLNECIRNGCTHYICLDVDEFYDAYDFKQAKDYIYMNDVHYSACKYINYVTPVLHRGLSNQYVPFICRVNQTSKNGLQFFVRTDPTRGVYTSNATSTHTFTPARLIMHHMETVRMDIHRKYASTTRFYLDRDRLKELSKIINSVEPDQEHIAFDSIIYAAGESYKLVKTTNKFNIPYTSW